MLSHLISTNGSSMSNTATRHRSGANYESRKGWRELQSSVAIRQERYMMKEKEDGQHACMLSHLISTNGVR